MSAGRRGAVIYDNEVQLIMFFLLYELCRSQDSTLTAVSVSGVARATPPGAGRGQALAWALRWCLEAQPSQPQRMRRTAGATPPAMCACTIVQTVDHDQLTYKGRPV